MVRVIGFKGVKEINNFSSVDERRNVIRVKKTLFGRMIEEAREKVMLILVKNFGRLRYEDIEEVYSDGCLVLWNKMESDSLELGGEDLVKYFIRICKNIGSHYLRKVDDRFVSFEDFVCEGSSDEEDGIMAMFDILDEVVISDEEKYKKLDNCWEKLKEVDRMILESYYWEGVKMDEIARRIGYKNADSVKSKKNKVLKKMMEMMKTEEGSHELPSLVLSVILPFPEYQPRNNSFRLELLVLRVSISYIMHLPFAVAIITVIRTASDVYSIDEPIFAESICKFSHALLV